MPLAAREIGPGLAAAPGLPRRELLRLWFLCCYRRGDVRSPVPVVLLAWHCGRARVVALG